MSISTELNKYSYLSFTIFIIGTISICSGMLLTGFLMGGRARARGKNIQFESGINSVRTEILQFSAKFALVAMFFVILDVEAIYIYVWATIIREAGWSGLIEASMLIIMLLAAIYYLVRINALDWTPNHRSKSKNRSNHKTITNCT